MPLERRTFLRAAFVLSGGLLLPDWLPKGRSMVVVPGLPEFVRVSYSSMLNAGLAEEFNVMPLRQFHVEEIAKMFKVPAHLIGYWKGGVRDGGI